MNTHPFSFVHAICYQCWGRPTIYGYKADEETTNQVTVTAVARISGSQRGTNSRVVIRSKKALHRFTGLHLARMAA
jgi:hypothetical protein